MLVTSPITTPLPLSVLETTARIAQRCDPTKRWAVLMSADDGSDVATVARFLEEAVFELAFGQDSDDMEAEYGPYRPISTLHLTIDLLTRRPAASARLLWGSGPDLKAVVDSVATPEWGVGWSEIAEFHGYDIDDVGCEIATLAALPEYRKVEANWAVKAMLASVMHSVLESGASAMMCTFCDASTRLINRIDAFDFARVNDLPDAMHVGALSWNGILDLRTYEERWTRERPEDPDFAALIKRYDESVHGGTQLPPIDLRDHSLIRQLVGDRSRRSVVGSSGE